jgi:hypothetical protein
MDDCPMMAIADGLDRGWMGDGFLDGWWEVGVGGLEVLGGICKLFKYLFRSLKFKLFKYAKR